MVLTSGFEPLLTDPQSVVLTTDTKLERLTYNLDIYAFAVVSVA